MILDDLAGYLEAGGIGLFGIDLFAGFCPKEAPDDCVTLYEYKGKLPVRTFSTGHGVVCELPRLQAVARSASYASARLKAHDVWLLLAGIGAVTLGATPYMGITPLEVPFSLNQKDKTDRFLIACNYEAKKEVSVF